MATSDPAAASPRSVATSRKRATSMTIPGVHTTMPRSAIVCMHQVSSRCITVGSPAMLRRVHRPAWKVNAPR